jgi:catechol 2,3-dioxygenase-like lactoylglutathione lyase family enzyme
VKLEHVALQVEDPTSVARWYVDHLGLTIARAQEQSPFGHFLADDGRTVMVEIYNNPKAAVPDYRQIDPLVLHLAFAAEDVAGTRSRLIAAGATAETDLQVNENGDEMTMLRDPWGVPLQLVRRKRSMIRAI